MRESRVRCSHQGQIYGGGKQTKGALPHQHNPFCKKCRELSGIVGFCMSRTSYFVAAVRFCPVLSGFVGFGVLGVGMVSVGGHSRPPTRRSPQAPFSWYLIVKVRWLLSRAWLLVRAFVAP